MKKNITIQQHLYAVTILFAATLAVFIGTVFIDVSRELFFVVAFLAFLLVVYGIAIILRSRKEKQPLKRWMIILGFSAIMPLVGSVLHNVFYALARIFPFAEIVFNFFDGLFFLAALLASPIILAIAIIRCFMIVKNNKS